MEKIFAGKVLAGGGEAARLCDKVNAPFMTIQLLTLVINTGHQHWSLTLVINTGH